MESNDPKWRHGFVCEGDKGAYRDEPWDGRDQTGVLRVAVSFLYACVEGVSSICLRSDHLLC